MGITTELLVLAIVTLGNMLLIAILFLWLGKVVETYNEFIQHVNKARELYINMPSADTQFSDVYWEMSR